MASTPELELGHELTRFARCFHRLKGELADLLPPGLDPAAAQLIAFLVSRGPSRQNEIADLTLLDPSTVSRRVSQLVSHGLAQRRPDPADGRASQLVATPAGEEFYARLHRRREALFHQVFATWPESDVDQFRRLISRFNDGIESLHQPSLNLHPLKESHVQR